MLEHGGRLNQAMAQFGGTQTEWIDLSTGINPQCYPAPLLPPAIWQRLPETSAELNAAACQYYGAPQVLAVAGTQAAIQALPRLRATSCAPARVVVAAPAYAEHAHHWSGHGHTVRQVTYSALAQALEDCDVMVICNPNNPTGECIAAAQLLLWAEHLAQRGGWLIVDEAFADMTPEISVAAYSAQPGLIVLRSVGKFFGLAGLRLGFVAAHSELLQPLETLLGPWTISTAAQLIGCHALQNHVWQQTMQQQLLAAGLRLQTLLQQFGISSSGSGLFQWWPEPRPEDFSRHMAQQKILVRLFTQAGRGIRLGLPADELAWQRLAAALQRWKQNG